MGDIWDYKLRRMEMAWELANRIAPSKTPLNMGEWNKDHYLASFQKLLEDSHGALKVVFNEDIA